MQKSSQSTQTSHFDFTHLSYDSFKQTKKQSKLFHLISRVMSSEGKIELYVVDGQSKGCNEKQQCSVLSHYNRVSENKYFLPINNNNKYIHISPMTTDIDIFAFWVFFMIPAT